VTVILFSCLRHDDRYSFCNAYIIPVLKAIAIDIALEN
jgi:hypothetical protein